MSVQTEVPTQVAPGSTESPAQTPVPESGEIPVSTASLSAAILAHYSADAPAAEAKPPIEPGPEPSPGAGDGVSTGETPIETDTKAASAEDAGAGEQLDLSAFKLPKDVAEKIQADFAKAIGRKHGKFKNAREEARALETKLVASEAAREAVEAALVKVQTTKAEPAKAEETLEASPRELATDPTMKHPEVMKLRATEDSAKAALKLTKDLLRRLSRDREGVLKVLEAQQVDLSDNSDEAIAEKLEQIGDNCAEKINAVGIQRALLVDRLQMNAAASQQQLSEEAVKIYPWHLDVASDKWKRAKQLVDENPNISQRPDYLLILGRQVEGEFLERERLKGNGTAKVVTKAAPMAAPKLPGATAAAATVPAALEGGDAVARMYFRKYQETGDAQWKQKWTDSMLDPVKVRAR